MTNQPGTYEFSNYSLSPARGELRQGDIVISLEREAMAVLVVLVEAGAQGASGEQVAAALARPSDSTQKSAITNIRRALDNRPGRASVIRTDNDGRYYFTLEATWVAGREERPLEPQQRPEPARWIYASMLIGMLMLLGLAMVMIPPV